MNAAAVVQVMTVDEARECVKCIKQRLGDVRYLLLDLYEREGWRALGYSSWRECATAEFEYGQAYVYRLLKAAEVERDISPQGEKPTPVPERYLRPLAKLEKPQERREAWDKVVETAPQGEITVKHVEKTVTTWTYNQGVQYGAAASTYSPPEPESKEDELTITIRAFELGYFMAMGKRYTLAQVAEEYELSPSGAYRLLARASGSKRVPLYPDDDTGVWEVIGVEARDWPY